jgi:hypothetical protein
MTWIADASLPAVAIWAALALTGLATGTVASRWGDPRGLSSPVIDGLLLAGAAAAVIAWCAIAGVLLSAAAPSAYLSANVPIAAGPGFRLAVLWATMPGASLTIAVILLVWGALSSRGGVTPGNGDSSRFAGVMSATAFVALGISAWFTPQANAGTTVIPTFVQSAPAALAPFLVVLAIAGLAVIVARALARRDSRAVLLATWVAATAAVVAEQMARSQLGIGPRDPVVLGRASSGLILWLAISALLHRRVQTLFRIPLYPQVVTGDVGSRHATRAGHAGAICLAISFAAHALAVRSTVALRPGESVAVSDTFRRPWQLVNQGVSRFDAEGVDVTALAIEARNASGEAALLTPEVREYHTPDGQHLQNTISLRKSTGGLLQTMRVLLTQTDSLDVASVRVTFLPAPFLWPLGVVLLGTSAILALSASPSAEPRRPSS